MANETLNDTFGETIPYDKASECNALMFDVLTLIHALLDAHASEFTGLDPEGLTDKASRMDNLMMQARQKTRAAINTLGL
jgi:hypothetical protein